MRQIPLTELDWQPPSGRIIPAELLAVVYRQADSKRRAHQDAVAIVNAARRKAESMIRSARKTCSQMNEKTRHELEQLRQDTLSRCESQWLQTHITYLLQDEALERALMHAVSDRIHYSIEQVLTAWFDQQPDDKTLCARLAKQAELMASEGALTLHFHPSQQENVRAALGSRFTLVLEPEFSHDHVILASPQLSVAFSLSNHFQQLLTWLRSPQREAGEQNESIGHHTGDEP
ncbi:type III secretion system stator protein SctL [Hafnia alvei]|uniref:Type III secretion apparatus protein, HrpE/YscL family n=1 Tax=Hafnia alvei TaxID=569 RepID=A0A1C6YUZ7_HAFAL|nr:type III secretion system stator protein SctL [Hafnia alvei]NLS55324.1 HrpE/YscL family type III secretion apparatus protein [Hafnia alvei]SCM50678.1 type III secretion apparatus protein, HrpE/YscL family [Hafnia alvei]